MRRLLFLILFPSALLAQTQSFTVAKIDTIKSKTDAQAVRVADSLTVSGKVTVSGNLAVDGDTISTDADLSINAAGGDMTFKGEIAEAAGWRVQTDSSSSNNSYRLFMAEDPANLFGFSHIYAGAANPNFGGTAFTLATNTYYFIRHDNSATGATVWSVARASNDIAFTGKVSPGGVTTEGALGVSAVNDTVRWTAQPASLGAANFANTTTGKLFRVHIYVNTTTAGSGGTVLVTISWNDGAAKTYATATADLTVTTNAGMVQDAITIYVASGTPTWATTVAGAAGSPAYSVNITLERLW